MKTTVAALLCGIALIGATPASADTTKCRTYYGPKGGSETLCDIFTDDGGWNSSETWCNANGDCTTESH